MNSKLIAVAIAGIVISIIIGAVVLTGPKLEKTEPKDPFEKWNRSGPFAIDKFQYKLGENIFVSVNGLTSSDVGKIIFGLPNGTTVYTTIPFDGGIKSEFNTYFTPSLSNARKICSTSDIVGEWLVVFRDTKYSPITFEIINKTLDDTKVAARYEKVC